MTTPNAVSRVFGTRELLEMILERLVTQDLVVMQRVSGAWKDMITLSPILQQNLFLQPTQTPPMAWSMNTPCDCDMPETINRFDFPKAVREGETYALDAKFNSSLLYHHDNLEPRALSLTWRILSGDYLFVNLPWSSNTLSCDKMFLTQPPTQAVNMILREFPSCMPPDFGMVRRSRARVRNEEGVRVEDVKKAVLARCGNAFDDGHTVVRIQFSGCEFESREKDAESLIFAGEEEYLAAREANGLVGLAGP